MEEGNAMSEKNEDCVFCKIIRGDIPSGKLYENDDVVAFKDIKPAAPTHILLVPKRHIPRLSAASAEDRELMGNFLLAAGKVASEAGLDDFRFIINDGPGAGQTVFHLHAHILGGRDMGEKLL